MGCGGSKGMLNQTMKGDRRGSDGSHGKGHGHGRRGSGSSHRSHGKGHGHRHGHGGVMGKCFKKFLKSEEDLFE